jgi:hypothetical protein
VCHHGIDLLPIVCTISLIIWTGCVKAREFLLGSPERATASMESTFPTDEGKGEWNVTDDLRGLKNEISVSDTDRAATDYGQVDRLR